MLEYELINRILRPRFSLHATEGDSFIMEETKECGNHGVHRVKVLKTSPVDSISLFRFSLDDEDFLPFYKDSRVFPDGHTEGGPSGLKDFCDYIMLAEKAGKLTVILIEMKRSKKSTHYASQLSASRQFMDFVIASANRIKSANGYIEFDPESISFRRVKIVHDPTCNKMSTRPRNKALDCGLDENIILHLGKHFNPAWVM